MYYWIAYLSDGKLFNSKDYTFPGSKSPWLILVEQLENENTKILSEKFGEKPFQELKQDYYACPFDIRPQVVEVKSIKLIVNGKVFNSASTSARARFKNSVSISHFWVFGISSMEFLGDFKIENHIGFSFLLDHKFRFYQWVDVDTSESWIEISSLEDARNKTPMRMLV